MHMYMHMHMYRYMHMHMIPLTGGGGGIQTRIFQNGPGSRRDFGFFFSFFLGGKCSARSLQICHFRWKIFSYLWEILGFWKKFQLFFCWQKKLRTFFFENIFYRKCDIWTWVEHFPHIFDFLSDSKKSRSTVTSEPRPSGVTQNFGVQKGHTETGPFRLGLGTALTKYLGKPTCDKKGARGPFSSTKLPLKEPWSRGGGGTMLCQQGTSSIFARFCQFWPILVNFWQKWPFHTGISKFCVTKCLKS